MTADDRVVAWDFETRLFRAGEQAPPIVCGSSASIVDGKIVGALHDKASSLQKLRQLLDSNLVIATANGAYDLAVAANADSTLLPLIFKLLREDRHHDVLIAESIHNIYKGTLFVDPRTGGDMRSPTTNKVTNRYSLELVHYFLTGKTDAKQNDVWRKSYALLENIPIDRWPAEARSYPIDDAVNTLEDALLQLHGPPGEHEWVNMPAIPGVCAVKTICKHCRGELTMAWPPHGSRCEAAPRHPHKNLENLGFQTRAAFAAWLGACHSFRTDPEKIEACEADALKKQAIYIERFKKKGWVRDDGSENTAVVKKQVALAYRTSGKCMRCGGTGLVLSTKTVECRGQKLRGRYQGCQDSSCAVCNGQQFVVKTGNQITCKNTFDKEKLERGMSRLDALIDAGCDGTGLDLATAQYLPRTDALGVKTNRDALTESGDDELADYGDDTWKKSITTYIPYLKKGITVPLVYSPNVVVDTGRYSYEDSPLHQMPRKGKERECLRARGAWCGSPIEYVLGFTDYEAGELVTLSQLTHWVVGYSGMREAINTTGKPGILHSDLAAQILGLSLEEFLKRLKNKDKQCVDFRQASKPYNFGRPGLMGAPKIVFTNRGRSVGFTPCEGGPAKNDDGVEGYHGIRFCILVGGAKSCGVEKITEWKRHPCLAVCKACTEIVENVIGEAYNKRYPEMKEYFNWVFKCLERYDNKIPTMVFDHHTGKPKIVRWRGAPPGEESKFKTAASNHGFQSMLAEMLKDAYWTMTEECYLGYKADGSPSPLAGCRVPLVVHDEPVSELILETAHLSGPRIAEIMVASSRKIAPDVVGAAETALSHHWHKAAEPSYHPVTGQLVPWEPRVNTKKAA